MIAYLDTNVVLWLAKGDLSPITEVAKQALETSDLLISPMLLLELQYLREQGEPTFHLTMLSRNLAFRLGFVSVLYPSSTSYEPQ